MAINRLIVSRNSTKNGNPLNYTTPSIDKLWVSLDGIQIAIEDPIEIDLDKRNRIEL